MKVFNRKQKPIKAFGSAKKEAIKQAFELREAIETPILKAEIRIDGNNTFEFGVTSIGLITDAIGEEKANEWCNKHLVKLQNDFQEAIKSLNEYIKTA